MGLKCDLKLKNSEFKYTNVGKHNFLFFKLKKNSSKFGCNLGICSTFLYF